MTQPYPPGPGPYPPATTVVAGGFSDLPNPLPYSQPVGAPAPGIMPNQQWPQQYPASGQGPYPPAGGFPHQQYPPEASLGLQPIQPPPQQQPPQQGPQSGEPSAPPIAQMGFTAPGYEESGYDPKPIAPPAFYPDIHHEQGDMDAFKVPKIEESDVIEALKEHVSDKCCWGSGPIENIKVTSIQMSSSYHYHLDTFTEQRETAWTFVPYDSIAHPVPPVMFQNPAPPAPWSIDARPDKEFKDSEKKIEVPNTSSVRACHGRCVGTGRMRCDSCNGTGNQNCTWCHSRGIKDEADGTTSRCDHCLGSGRKQCSFCPGSGMKTCPTCQGLGNVRWFIELQVKWDNHDDDFVSDASGLKKKYIKQIDGKMAVDAENIRVFPLQSFPDRSIAEASQKLIEKHNKDYPMERILKQRHSVKVVPVATVHYDHKDNNGVFYVYGDEADRRVYFKDYPARCCYCCSIA